MQDVKYKRAWKGAGSQNEVFMVAPILKPKVLDPWEQARIIMPERVYHKFIFGKDYIPIIISSLDDQKTFNQFTPCKSKGITEPGEDKLTEGYREFL